MRRSPTACPQAGQIPELLPTFVDSPMAFDALVYRRALREGHPDVRPELHGARGAGMLDPGGLREVRAVEGSKAPPSISSCCTANRMRLLG